MHISQKLNKKIKKKIIYFSILSLSIEIHGMNTTEQINITEGLLNNQKEIKIQIGEKPNINEKLSENDVNDVEDLKEKRENIVNVAHSTMGFCVFMAILNIIWNFIDADTKAVFYVQEKVQQIIYENTQSVVGLVLSIIHLILVGFLSIDLKNRILKSSIFGNVSDMSKKIISYILQIILPLSTLFVFAMYIACASNTSGGEANIIFEPDSKVEIPIQNTWSNNQWTCNPTGSSAAPNVWNYYNTILNLCFASNLYDDNCIWDFGWYAFLGGFTHVYFLFIWYSIMIITVFGSMFALHKIDNQIKKK